MAGQTANSPLLEGWLRSRRGVLANWLTHNSENHLGIVGEGPAPPVLRPQGRT